LPAQLESLAALAPVDAIMMTMTFYDRAGNAMLVNQISPLGALSDTFFRREAQAIAVLLVLHVWEKTWSRV